MGGLAYTDLIFTTEQDKRFESRLELDLDLDYTDVPPLLQLASKLPDSYAA